LHPHGLRPWPHAKIDELPSLRRQLVKVRKQGYGVNVEESEPGVTAIGMSVGSRWGRPMAALSVAAPTARFHRRQEPELSRHLLEVRMAAEGALAAALP
jgi:DNA-binding IclR family transcriptional regulator